MSKLFNTIPLMLISFVSAGAISAVSAELPTRGPIPFTSYDLDGNGFITEQEFNQLRSKRAAEKTVQGGAMKRVGNAPSFSAFDKDNDGQLTQQELATGQQIQVQNRRSSGGQGPGAGQGRGKGAGMSKGKNMPSFSQYDLYGDGDILEQEFYDARAKRIKERTEQGYPMRNLVDAPTFAEIDTNGNAKISPEEFVRHQVIHRQKKANKSISDETVEQYPHN